MSVIFETNKAFLQMRKKAIAEIRSGLFTRKEVAERNGVGETTIGRVLKATSLDEYKQLCQHSVKKHKVGGHGFKSAKIGEFGETPVEIATILATAEMFGVVDKRIKQVNKDLNLVWLTMILLSISIAVIYIIK